MKTAALLVAFEREMYGKYTNKEEGDYKALLANKEISFVSFMVGIGII